MTTEKREAIVTLIGIHFRCFGGGRTAGAEWNPLVMALKDRPLTFAAGVDVSDVVDFIIAKIEELPEDKLGGRPKKARVAE